MKRAFRLADGGLQLCDLRLPLSEFFSQHGDGSRMLPLGLFKCLDLLDLLIRTLCLRVTTPQKTCRENSERRLELTDSTPP